MRCLLVHGALERVARAISANGSAGTTTARNERV